MVFFGPYFRINNSSRRTDPIMHFGNCSYPGIPLHFKRLVCTTLKGGNTYFKGVLKKIISKIIFKQGYTEV